MPYVLCMNKDCIHAEDSRGDSWAVCIRSEILISESKVCERYYKKESGVE